MASAPLGIESVPRCNSPREGPAVVRATGDTRGPTVVRQETSGVRSWRSMSGFRAPVSIESVPKYIGGEVSAGSEWLPRR